MQQPGSGPVLILPTALGSSRQLSQLPWCRGVRIDLRTGPWRSEELERFDAADELITDPDDPDRYRVAERPIARPGRDVRPPSD